MKSHEKKLIGALIAIFVVIIIILLLTRGNNNNNQQQATQSSQSTTQQGNQTTVKTEENVKIVNGDTKLNKSNNFSETRTFENLEFSDVQLTEKGGVTQFIATVKNLSKSTNGDFAVKLPILDRDGKIITEAHGYIAKLEPGQSTQLSVSKTFDYVNAYDYKIEKE